MAQNCYELVAYCRCGLISDNAASLF